MWNQTRNRKLKERDNNSIEGKSENCKNMKRSTNEKGEPSTNPMISSSNTTIKDVWYKCSTNRICKLGLNRKL